MGTIINWQDSVASTLLGRRDALEYLPRQERSFLVQDRRGQTHSDSSPLRFRNRLSTCDAVLRLVPGFIRAESI